MNRTARRLGLRRTSYANPIGLDQPGNYSSPGDLAALALRLRSERVFRRIVDTHRITLHTGDRPRKFALGGCLRGALTVGNRAERYSSRQ